MLPVLKTLLGCLSEDHRIICILVFFLGQNAAQPHRIKIRNSEVCSPLSVPPHQGGPFHCELALLGKLLHLPPHPTEMSGPCASVVQ